MAESSLPQKIGIKPGHQVLILYPPQGYIELLGALPEGVQLNTSTQPEGVFDVVQCFVQSKADIDSRAPVALRALKPGGILWFSHPKKSSKIKTDISRDVGWDAVRAEGMETVATISIDDTWSGLRFRPLKMSNPARRRDKRR